MKERNVYIPLGTNANKQDACGGCHSRRRSKFQGVLGSAVVKVFDLTLAKTGISEEEAKEINLPYKSITVQAPSHAATYPDQERLRSNWYMKRNKRLLGAQMAGEKESLKAGCFALAIDRKMTTEELRLVNFCYSPPYATPWDAANYSECSKIMGISR